jgi:CRISPR-associated protein Cas1
LGGQNHLTTLYDRLCDRDLLLRAWYDIDDKHGLKDPYAVRKFAPNANMRIDRILVQLKNRNYHPDLFSEYVTKKKSGEDRVLHIPTVRDRIVERAILGLIGPVCERRFLPCSYAYRPGYGIKSVMARIAELAEEGLFYALRSDIDDCFPCLNKRTALTRLIDFVNDDSLRDLLERFINRKVITRNGIHQTQGLPQGSPLSPLMLNVYLHMFDERMAVAGFHMLRYADDFVVMTETRKGAEIALSVVELAIGKENLVLSKEKTEIMSIKGGFTFLGEYVSLESVNVTQRSLSVSESKTLFIGKQGVGISIKEGRLVCESAGGRKLMDCPIGSLKRVVIFGAVGVSAGVRTLFSMRGIEILYLTKNGKFLGTTALGNAGDKPKRLKKQLALTMDEDFALQISKTMIEAKIRHCLSVICNYTKDDCIVSDCRRRLKIAERSLSAASTRDQIRGIEGETAAFYFAAFGKLVPETLMFAARTKRPPKDVFNALLGYGYAILLGECISALYAAGLSPYFGFLHADEDGRPNLALDFMEEFRPYVVDTLVLRLVRRRSITHANGVPVPNGDGIHIDGEAKKKLTEGYEHRMLTITKGALLGFTGSIRRVLYRQAQMLLSSILSGDAALYGGVIWR